MNKNFYMLSTLIYAFIFVVAFALSIYFGLQKQWLLMIIAILMMLTCLDNFFCGSRACNAGYHIKTHYALPPFLKKK
jgi:hypothetical protein